MTATQVMQEMRALPMYVCDPVAWFLGYAWFDPIRMEEWLVRRGRMGGACCVRDALVANWGPELACAVEENIRNGGEKRP